MASGNGAVPVLFYGEEIQSPAMEAAIRGELCAGLRVRQGRLSARSEPGEGAKSRQGAVEAKAGRDRRGPAKIRP